MFWVILWPCQQLHLLPASKLVFFWVLLNCALTSIQLHPPRPCFTQLHPPPPSSLHPNRDLDFWNSVPNSVHFWAKLGQKRQSCLFCLKIGTHGIWRMVIVIATLVLWNSDPKIHFWANLEPKSQYRLFCLKISTHSISRMLILIPTLVYWIRNPNVPFSANLRQNSHGSRFLFQHLFAEFQTKNQFLAKFGPKKSELSILPENWHTWYLEDGDSYSEISFLTFKT